MSEHVLAYVIEFADGGSPEGGVLHSGTAESCEAVRAALPAVAYRGARPVSGVQTVICPRDVFDRCMEEDDGG